MGERVGAVYLGRMAPTPAADALARLYAAPLGEFVKVRTAIASELRAAGETASARRVTEARKPSRTAWGLNQVARRSPDAVRAVLDAYVAATEVQGRGDAHAVRMAIDQHRARLGEVTRAVRKAMTDAGMPPTPAQLRPVGETLQAAALHAAVRTPLLAGRLEADASLENPFASLGASDEDEAPALAEPRRRAPAAPKKPATDDDAKPRDAAAKKRTADDPKARVADAKKQAAEAKKRAAEANKEAAEAKKEAAQAERARRRAEAARAQAEAASRREIAAVERDLTKARAALERAETERTRAAGVVDDLAEKLTALHGAAKKRA